MGGDPAALERVKPWLLAMGTAVTHVGPLGLAKTMKVATNLGLAVYILSSAAGIGAGFLGSFLTTRDGIKVGYSSLMLGGAAWGGALTTSLGLGLERTGPGAAVGWTGGASSAESRSHATAPRLRPTRTRSLAWTSAA